MSDIAALGAQAETMIAALAKISAEPARLVRLYLSPEHRRAADLVAGWMREFGLTVSEDALGTVRGHWPGNGARKRLLIGSHLDTVIDAGKYDGPLGVIAGIIAAEHFVRAGRALPVGIEVLAFGDEEGSRFPSTLATSAACVGAFEGSTLALTPSSATARTSPKFRRPPTAATRSPPMSRSTSSRDRCWRQRTSRSASSPASSGRAACA